MDGRESKTPWIPDRRQNGLIPIGNQSWKVAQQPGPVGIRSNPAFGNQETKKNQSILLIRIVLGVWGRQPPTRGMGGIPR